MPSAAWPACPDCGSEAAKVLHEANPDAESTHATLECGDCGRVFRDVIERPSSTEVDCVISEGAESRPGTIELDTDERVRVGDERLADDHRLLVTGLESEDGRRLKSATPDMLGTVWCKVFDTVTLDVSVNQGHKTWTGEVTAAPEDAFLVGDELSLTWGDAEIHAIKIDAGVLHRGSAQARDIKRLYAKAMQGEPIPYGEVHRKDRSDVP